MNNFAMASVGLARVISRILVVIAAALLINAAAVAQEDVFEEIIVHAQKREQNIMDVPIAVSAITGSQIVDAGISTMFDLQQNVPSLLVNASQTATTSNFSIRGIGSTANNFGVESSVGLYVDGVYRSRQSSLINDLVDVEAVEILRGPQGTLFGKNTPAGAIQVRTVAPSQDRDAFIDVTAGDYSLVQVSAAANIPINENLSFRGTVFATQRDGYVDDIALGKDVYNDRDRIGTRLQLLYEPSDDFNMRIIVDYAEIDEICCAALTLIDGIYSHSNIASFPDPAYAGSDSLLLVFGGTVFTDFPYPQAILDGLAAAIPQGTVMAGVGIDDLVGTMNFLPESKNEDSGVSVEINKTFDSGMTLTSITAFRSFNTKDRIDADFSNVDLLTRINDAEQSSFSQEFRLAGEFGSGSNYLVGLYYFGQEIDQSTDTFGGAFGQAYLNNNPLISDLVGFVDFVETQAGFPYQPAGLPFLPRDPLTEPGIFANDAILQDQDGWAVFGQVDFALGDDFLVTLGARYTDETKKMDAVYTQNTPAGPVPDFNAISLQVCAAQMCDPAVPPFNPADPATFAVFAPFFVDGWGAYGVPPISPRPDLNEKLTDDQTTGTVKLTWFASDASMIYASYSTGFKSGGTNTERISPAFDPLFGAETSESFEVGYKGTLGPVRLALTYYDTDFDDFQAQTFTGTGFNLQNAGSIENTGFEVEAFYRPTDSFEAQVIYTHNEADFASFENGTCWDSYPFHTGIQDPGLPPGFNEVLDAQVCDKSGNPLANNSEDRWFIGLEQTFDLSATSSMYLRFEYSSASEMFTDGDLDPFTLQDDFEIMNARIGFNFGQSNSSITLWGRNITDERYHTQSSDSPIQVGRMHGYPAPPATYGVTFRKNFD